MISITNSKGDFLFVRRWYGIRWFDYDKHVTTKNMIKDESYVTLYVHNKLGRRRWRLKFKDHITNKEKQELIEKLMVQLERYEP